MTGSGTDTARPADRSVLEPIPLPETRRGGRAQLRRERRRKRRNRNVGIATVLLVAVAVGAVLVAVRDDRDGASSGTDAPAGGAAAVPPVLLAQHDGSGRAVSLVVLAPAPDGKGGNIVLVPPGTMTEVVSLGLEPVARSLELGGPPRLQSTMENLLGATLATAVVVNDEALASLLAPVGPLVVRVPERVEQVAPSGRVEVLYEAGEATVQPAEVGRFLSVKGQANDITRLARHQTFLEAWLAAMRARPDVAPTEPPALARAFDALAAGNVRTRVLPVEAFGTAGTEGELYRVRTDDLARMVEAVFPTARTPGAGARPRIQILNGTGAVGLADAVATKLGPGFDVRLTGNAGSFDHDRTEVVFYDRAKQSMADQVRDALGVGTIVFSRRPLSVVDVTIIVGKDFTPA